MRAPLWSNHRLPPVRALLRGQSCASSPAVLPRRQSRLQIRGCLGVAGSSNRAERRRTEKHLAEWGVPFRKSGKSHVRSGQQDAVAQPAPALTPRVPWLDLTGEALKLVLRGIQLHDVPNARAVCKKIERMPLADFLPCAFENSFAEDERQLGRAREEVLLGGRGVACVRASRAAEGGWRGHQSQEHGKSHTSLGRLAQWPHRDCMSKRC